MKLHEFITLLQKYYTKHGDIEVWIKIDSCAIEEVYGVRHVHDREGDCIFIE